MRSASPWETLAARPARRLAAGAFVYLTRDAARSVYFVRGGLVKVSLVWRDGREYILRLVRPGDTFGETSLGEAEHQEQARTLEPSEIVTIPIADLFAEITRDGGRAAEFLQQLGRRVVEAQQAACSLAFAGTQERLCQVLARLADEIGEPAGRSTTIPHYIRQEDVARMTGARREVVSGLLNRLRDERVIGYTRKGTLRVNRSALDRFAQAIRAPGGEQ